MGRRTKSQKKEEPSLPQIEEKLGKIGVKVYVNQISSLKALVGWVSKWLNEYIEKYKVMPTTTGHYYFVVRKSTFLKTLGRSKISSTAREYFKMYGFKLTVKGQYVEIDKFI